MAHLKPKYGGFEKADIQLTPIFEWKELKRIYGDKLSGSTILTATAGAMNRACRDVITKILKPEIKRNFNVENKYLANFARNIPRARANYLESGVVIHRKPIPIMAFTQGLKQTKEGVEVQIRKGETTTIMGAFLATPGETKKYKRGERRGQIRIEKNITQVFKRGYYAKRGFVPTTDRGGDNKSALTRLHTISPWAAGLSDVVAPQVNQYILNESCRGLIGQLDAKIKEINLPKS